MEVTIKYILAGVLMFFVFCAPAYIARQTKKDKTDMFKVRVASWLLGWTGVGYLLSLYWAVKK